MRRQHASFLAFAAMLLLAASCVSAFVVPAPFLLVGARGASAGSSTSFQPLSLFNTFKDPEAEEDDGAKPTKAELKKLHKMRGNVRYPKRLTVEIKATFGPLIRVFRRIINRKDTTNKTLFKYLEIIRSGTAVTDKTLDGVDFSNNVKPTLFYETKKPSLKSKVAVMAFYPLLENAPELEDQGGEADYDELLKGLIPAQVKMNCNSAKECFLQNAPAFCSPESKGSSRSVCDLTYLQKYQVKKGTPARYGGKAVVAHGEIVSVDDVTPTSDPVEFERKVNIFLSSFAVHVVVTRHALMAHLAIYQRLLVKLTTNQNEDFMKGFDGTHGNGPKYFLQGLLTGTNDVSYKQQLLTGPGNGLVARASSLTNLSLLQLGSDVWDKFKNMKPCDVVADVAEDGSPKWENACTKAYSSSKKAVTTILKDLLDKGIIDESHADDISLLVWAGTFYHAFIGDFQADNLTKGYLPFPLTGELHLQDLSFGTVSATITATVMTRTVDMRALSLHFPKQEQRDAWEGHLAELAALDIGVEGYSVENVYNSINF